MIETVGRRLSQTGRLTLVLSGAGVLGMLAALAAAAPAQAGLQEEYAVFAHCPVNAPNVTTCLYSKVTSGEFTLGSKTVAIEEPVILQGAISSASPDLVPPTNGETLSRTPLTVPGGLTGVDGLGGEVTATAELAGPVEQNSLNLLSRKGTATALPLKVKLENPALGEACYLGSESEPVDPHLTTGTTSPPSPNTPISGRVGGFEFGAGENITIVPVSLVDNAFSVPGANGCGALPPVVDLAVDASAGVPSAAGHNTAIMNGVIETAQVAAVKNQAALPEVGRCVRAQSTGEGKEKVFHGAYEDKGCTTEVQAHEGKYEWIAGAAKPKFAAKGAALTLEGAGGDGVTCTSSAIAGEYTGTKTLTASVTFKGCTSVAGKGACQSGGAHTGVIVANGLTGTLGFIADEMTEEGLVASVGLDLSGEPSLFSADCAGGKEEVVVKGSVIAPISAIDAMTRSFSLAYSASAAKQSPEQFEAGSKDTLSATLGSGAEPVGLSTTEKIANQESLEIKAAALG
jgi:hypothetical protein